MTPSAIAHRVSRLRQRAKELEGAGSAESPAGDDTQTATPKATPNVKATSKGRARPVKAEMSTPKPKAAKSKAAGKIIKEEDAGEEVAPVSEAIDPPTTPPLGNSTIKEGTPDLMPDSGAEAEPTTPTPVTPTRSRVRKGSTKKDATGKIQSGRVEKKRSSPRNANKQVSYADMLDPFTGVPGAADLFGLDDGQGGEMSRIQLADEMALDDISDSDDDFVDPVSARA